jgi:hypothetical protein
MFKKCFVMSDDVSVLDERRRVLIRTVSSIIELLDVQANGRVNMSQTVSGYPLSAL